MSISEIQLYQLFTKKLGETEAEQLISFVKGEVKTEFDTKRQSLASKDDITHIKDDITHIREDMNHIREDMLNIKSDLSKSIYVVGLVQFIAIVGSVITIFSFMLK